jgi:hypothetical protein
VKPLLTFRLLGAAVAVAMLIGAAAARASDATTLADRAGFLVGHALRCGVAEARLKRSATLIGDLIGAYALDGDDRNAAQSAFMQRVVASASAKTLGEPLPSCTTVRTQLARFEQHRQIAATRFATPTGQLAADSSAGSDSRSSKQGSRVASLQLR